MNLDNVAFTVQPHKSLVQAEWGDAEDDIYTIPLCKGAELSSAGTAGVLEVHLAGDAADKWYLMPLIPSETKGRLFNQIRTTNTTVNLALVTCFPT